jgi:hypothetical protein
VNDIPTRPKALAGYIVHELIFRSYCARSLAHLLDALLPAILTNKVRDLYMSKFVAATWSLGRSYLAEHPGRATTDWFREMYTVREWDDFCGRRGAVYTGPEAEHRLRIRDLIYDDLRRFGLWLYSGRLCGWLTDTRVPRSDNPVLVLYEVQLHRYILLLDDIEAASPEDLLPGRLSSSLLPAGLFDHRV